MVVILLALKRHTREKSGLVTLSAVRGEKIRVNVKDHAASKQNLP